MTNAQPKKQHLNTLGEGEENSYHFTLRNELASIELSDHALQDLVDDGGQNSFIIIGSQFTIDLRKVLC